MKVAALIWSGYYGLLAGAAAKAGGVDFTLYSSKNLETVEARQKSLMALKEADAIFVYSSNDDFWDEYAEPIKEIGRRRRAFQ